MSWKLLHERIFNFLQSTHSVKPSSETLSPLNHEETLHVLPINLWWTVSAAMPPISHQEFLMATVVKKQTLPF